MNIIYMGNSEFGIPVLNSLAKHEKYKPVAVVTNPPKPMGRGKIMAETPAGIAARTAGLKMLQPHDLKEPGFISDLKALKPDLFIVVAYRILPGEILAIPAIGSINLHGSLLPEYRGAAPIQRAIMDGKKETGLTTFLIEPKVDTGAILLRRTFQIDVDMDYGALSEKMSLGGPDIIFDSISALEDGSIKPVRQNHSHATPAPKISSQDKIITWDKHASEIHNKVRGLSPAPGAHTKLGQKRYKIFKTRIATENITGLVPGEIWIENGHFYVGTGSETLEIIELQREGGKKMHVSEFLKGFQAKKDMRFKDHG